MHGQCANRSREPRGAQQRGIRPRAGPPPALVRVGLNVTWTSKTPRTSRPSWSGASGPSYARGRRHGPRGARWRRERVGRAVIRDVAIRAAPVRCPHKQNPEPRPNTFTRRPRPHERGGDRHGAPPIQPHPVHPSAVATSRSADQPTTPVQRTAAHHAVLIAALLPAADVSASEQPEGRAIPGAADRVLYVAARSSRHELKRDADAAWSRWCRP
jgi:hypothetical protein